MLVYFNGRITLNLGEKENVEKVQIYVEKSASNRNFDLQKFLGETQAYLNLLIQTGKDIMQVCTELQKKFKLSEVRVVFQNGSGFVVKK